MGERDRERQVWGRVRERVRIQGWERETGLGKSERERERVRIQGWEREISFAKNEEYRKAKSFIWMF